MFIYQFLGGILSVHCSGIVTIFYVPTSPRSLECFFCLVRKTGLPNRSDFCGKGPNADLFALQGPEIGPEITKKVRISGSRFEISSFAVKLDVKWWLW